ncbi:WXG100 family type VII secretion target [Candidatus Mycobacterium wuenschmannii]|uniref:WXG100 family type VII secretion target n=1 Tax=Candidatus Mycobacterium wuenschmannii TaxID=3027808 RepID=A0ABY8VT44_9MYCO|nr:WXG100 family type VII secretion target [Candidatus Mycobacterium wuenschmannii]WIM85827.1 WXG100 family type VII secretion target [Candidatus Mycobacterium wuenschmannii]
MADNVWLKPHEVSQAANDMADHGETLMSSHQSSHSEASGAHAGWVGSSAGALAGLLDDWQTAGTEHFHRIGNHSCDMHVTVAEFTLLDQHSTQRLERLNATHGETPPMQ